MKRKLLGIATILLLGCPLYALQVSAQEVIFVARHTDPQMLLLLDAPIQDDTPLSETGRTQAEVLTARLKDAGITAIYTSKTARTIETAAPMAKELGLDITSISRRDVDGLIQRLRKHRGNDRVLVVGHWTTMPKILQRLGYPEEVKIERSVRNDLFIVMPKSNGPPVVVYLHY